MSIAPPPNARTIRSEIFEAIKASEYGLTDEQIQLNLGLFGNTERPRRGELVKQGRIQQFGTRETESGRQAVVWIANEFPMPPKDIVSLPKAITVTHYRGEGRQVRKFKSFVTVEGNTQIITLPMTFQILSGDTLTIK